VINAVDTGDAATLLFLTGIPFSGTGSLVLGTISGRANWSTQCPELLSYGSVNSVVLKYQIVGGQQNILPSYVAVGSAMAGTITMKTS